MRLLVSIIFLNYFTCTFGFLSFFQNPPQYKYAKEYYDFLVKYDKIESDPKHKLRLLGTNKDNFVRKREQNYHIFENNLCKIREHNKYCSESDFSLDLNQFADTHLFDESFKGVKKHSECDDCENCDCNDTNILLKNFKYFNFNDICKYISKSVVSLRKSDLDPNINWQSDEIPIKNQKNCGSCWAFASTTNIQYLMQIHDMDQVHLSEQELVDCSKKNSGCQGGLMHLAFDYIIKKKGLMSDFDYPYVARNQACSKKQFPRVKGSDIKNYEFTVPRSIADMKRSLKNGPISIAIDANNLMFRFYKNGVLDVPENYATEINHAVLLLGYGNDKNGGYWIIQNSWGKQWGDNGYAKIRIREGDGVLLSQLYGVYPIIK